MSDPSPHVDRGRGRRQQSAHQPIGFCPRNRVRQSLAGAHSLGQSGHCVPPNCRHLTRLAEPRGGRQPRARRSVPNRGSRLGQPSRFAVVRMTSVDLTSRDGLSQPSTHVPTNSDERMSPTFRSGLHPSRRPAACRFPSHCLTGCPRCQTPTNERRPVPVGRRGPCLGQQRRPALGSGHCPLAERNYREPNQRNGPSPDRSGQADLPHGTACSWLLLSRRTSARTTARNRECSGQRRGGRCTRHQPPQ